jgi:hypothetical protein
MSSKKKNYGQFFTTNYEYILQGFSIPQYVYHNDLKIIEPFAGKGDLVKYIEEQKYEMKNIECYDIDPKENYIKKRDTLNKPPSYNNKYVITNPPYLARNKSDTKDLFEKYECNDLYKCFIKELITNKCVGGIVIVPLNFFSSIRKNDVELRRDFLHVYSIKKINIFEEQVFDDTSYTVCSFQFQIISEPIGDKDDNRKYIKVNIYPCNKKIITRLDDSNNYMIGGEIYKLELKNKYKITRLTSKNKDKKNTNILVKCIDDNEKNKIGLSYVEDDKIYIDETPNLSSRTYATLVIEPKLSVSKQKILVEKFNTFLNEKREEYHSLFLTNYRESKDIARKRISFELVYDICNYLL